jgi:hypothetical protein
MPSYLPSRIHHRPFKEPPFPAQQARQKKTLLLSWPVLTPNPRYEEGRQAVTPARHLYNLD